MNAILEIATNGGPLRKHAGDWRSLPLGDTPDREHLERWHNDMLAAGQQPVVYQMTSWGLEDPRDTSKHLISEILEVTGRDFDPDRDFERWAFMRVYAEPIREMLKSWGRTRDIECGGRPHRVSAARKYFEA